MDSGQNNNRTSGKIRVGRLLEDYCEILSEDGVEIARTDREFLVDTNPADADHIVACWNVCEEIGPKSVLAVIAAAKDFVQKVDEGRARSTDSYNKFSKALNPRRTRPIEMCYVGTLEDAKRADTMYVMIPVDATNIEQAGRDAIQETDVPNVGSFLYWDIPEDEWQDYDC